MQHIGKHQAVTLICRISAATAGGVAQNERPLRCVHGGGRVEGVLAPDEPAVGRV